MWFIHSCVHCSALQPEEFPVLEEGDESATSQSIAMDQEVTLGQSDTPDQFEQEVIVIVTDTESENDQEEEDEEEEEQVVFLLQIVRRQCLKFKMFLDSNTLILHTVGL